MPARQSLTTHCFLECLHDHPQFIAVAKIISALQKQGFQTVFAGGCVRDSLLGIRPKDLDIATAAPPEVVEGSFARTLAVGKAFGTIVVIEDGHNFEVTTFRKDGPYVDGRHPDHVEFSDIEEDARRRDFTINALFYASDSHEILDFVGGVEDLRLGFLRTVGSPQQRFQEDKLRMLRAVRFVAQLGFALDEAALRAIQHDYQTLRQVSQERIFNEMRRLLQAEYLVQGLHILRDSRLSEIIWPELAHANVDRLRFFLPLRGWENVFAALTLLSGAHRAGDRLRAWKAPRDSAQRIQTQIDACKILLNPESSRAARARVLGSPDFAEVLALAQGFLVGNAKLIQDWIAEYLTVAEIDGSLPKPLLTGQDLIAEGYAPGQEMGKLLKALYDAQLEGLIVTREEALRKIRS